MANYVAVPAHDIESFLQSKGFIRKIRGQEVVYERSHDKNAQVKVLVYTSIRVGQYQVRGCGRDAIKVCTILETPRKTYPLGKFPRVLRVGKTETVLERILQRMRGAYARGSEWIAEHPSKYERKEKPAGGYARVECTTPLDE